MMTTVMALVAATLFPFGAAQGFGHGRQTSNSRSLADAHTLIGCPEAATSKISASIMDRSKAV